MNRNDPPLFSTGQGDYRREYHDVPAWAFCWRAGLILVLATITGAGLIWLT